MLQSQSLFGPPELHNPQNAHNIIVLYLCIEYTSMYLYIWAVENTQNPKGDTSQNGRQSSHHLVRFRTLMVYNAKDDKLKSQSQAHTWWSHIL